MTTVARSSRNLEGLARYSRSYAVWLLLFASIGGSAQTLIMADGLRKFGGLEYLSRVIGLSVVRERAADVLFGAGLLAWITVCHGLDKHGTCARFRPIAVQASLCCAIGLPVAIVVSLLASLGVAVGFLGIGAEQYLRAWNATVTSIDYGFAVLMSFECLVILLITGWLSVPVVADANWRLRTKLMVACAVLVAVRVVVDSIDAVVRA